MYEMFRKICWDFVDNEFVFIVVSLDKEYKYLEEQVKKMICMFILCIWKCLSNYVNVVVYIDVLCLILVEL